MESFSAYPGAGRRIFPRFPGPQEFDVLLTEKLSGQADTFPFRKPMENRPLRNYFWHQNCDCIQP
jgi:hypothetical protein